MQILLFNSSTFYELIVIYFLVRKDLEIPTTPPKPSKNTIEISIPKRPDSKMYLSAIWNLVHE